MNYVIDHMKETDWPQEADIYLEGIKQK